MKSFIAFIIALCLAHITFAQTDSSLTPPPPQRENHVRFRDRLFGGGDLGLQFGTVTLINLAPVIGYKVTDNLGVGVGPIYTYFNDKQYSYSSNQYGGRVFGQYRVLENVLAYSEYQLINAEVFDDFRYRLIRYNIPSFLVGGGYVMPIGESSSFMIMALWDVIQDPYSYYANPVIRAGINLGF